VLVEETLSHGPVEGSLTLGVGAEVEVGWLRASVVPGVVIPTVTDPNGISETLRLRLVAAPSTAFQVQADLRQTFGARPDTTLHVGVSVGFGSASPIGSPASWFSRSAIEGIVFVDDNGNGVFDAGERGVPGVPVQVGAGKTVVTDANGRYRVGGLRDGVHQVSIERAALPANLRLASASTVPVELPRGGRNVSFAFVGSGMIHGMVFNDVAFTGRFTGSQPGIAAEVVVEGPGVRRQLAVNGSFSVGGLAPGRYRVSVDPLSLPASYTIDRAEIDVEIGAGDSATAQFPVIAVRALAITACLGRGSRACEPGDAPAIGLRVVAGTNAVTTDGKGRALVRQLPAGRVTVTVDPAAVPAGFRPPAPVTIEVPGTPTTLPVSIRLEPSR
jgi:hypothetical protein